MNKYKQPPRLIDRVMEKYCDPILYEGIKGDLTEIFNDNLDAIGTRKANWIYFFQCLGFFRPKFKRKTKNSNYEAMFRNYFLITYRNLTKHTFYSVINIVGLAIGMAAGFLILQYVFYELTYDSFFENKENIYRIQTNRYNKGELTTQWAAGAAGAGLHMKEDFPEVEEFVNLSRSSLPIVYNNEYYKIEYPFYAGESFFKVFSVPLISGVDSLVLKEPFTAVISRSLATKIFRDEDPVGKIVKQRNTRDFTITGIFEDLPERSHMRFDILYSFETLVSIYGNQNPKTEWQHDGYLNYVVLRNGTDPKELENKFPDFIQAREGEELKRTNTGMEFVLQPLPKIHLISDYREEIKTTGNETTTYFLLIIGLFVLGIAWINYINLTTARSMSRAKEVGIRKVMGSHRSHLIRQFMFESYAINLFSLIVATVLIFTAFPFFNDFVGRSQPYTWPDSTLFWVGLILVFVFGTLLSGFYPALFLSRFKPAVVLKGRFLGTSGANWLRKGLVTFQFLASVVLITGTFVVYEQLRFLDSQELGVNIDQTLVIETPNYQSDSIFNLRDNIFKNELYGSSFVQEVTSSTDVPGGTPYWNAGGIRLLTQGEDEGNQYRIIGCDEKFIDFYGLELIAGRKFDDSFGTEEYNVIFNESAVKMIGFQDANDLIGREIQFWGDTFNVVGVIKDYRQESPKTAYDALIFRYFPSSSSYYSINVKTSSMKEVVSQVFDKWEQAFGNKPFNHFFLNDHYNNQYQAELKFGTIFGLFSSLAIIVACLGLFGLASYMINLRTKEIGVRKVLGASLQQLWILLTSDFLKLVLTSIIIAIPLNWWLMKNWLENFENRINLGPGIYFFPAVLLLTIALVTVFYHTYKASMMNPAQSLHDE